MNIHMMCLYKRQLTIKYLSHKSLLLQRVFDDIELYIQMNEYL
jgi:hypothetical protein